MLDFRDSDATEHPFPPGLDNHERYPCTVSSSILWSQNLFYSRRYVQGDSTRIRQEVGPPHKEFWKRRCAIYHRVAVQAKAAATGRRRGGKKVTPDPNLKRTEYRISLTPDSLQVPVLGYTEESLLAMQDHFEAYPLDEESGSASVRDAVPAAAQRKDPQASRKNKWPPNYPSWQQKCAASMAGRMKLPSYAAKDELVSLRCYFRVYAAIPGSPLNGVLLVSRPLRVSEFSGSAIAVEPWSERETVPSSGILGAPSPPIRAH